jgi:MFS family permease
VSEDSHPEESRLDGAAQRADSAGRRIIDRTYGSADRLIDRGQQGVFRILWFFFPDTALLGELRFRQVAASRFLSDAGQQSLGYAALISVVREGGSAFEAALVGMAGILPAAFLGLFGGAVADMLPKRLALAFAYGLQAALCILTPSLLGTDLAAIIFLLLAVNTLAQVSSPTESSVLPYVATREQLASAAALIGLSATAGIAVGTALLAPILVSVFGVSTAFYVSGALLLLAANRIFDLKSSGEGTRRDGRRVLNLELRPMDTVRLLSRQPAVATMVMVAVLAGTAQIVMQTLAPRFVVAVLESDAANTVYVFAPAAVGSTVAFFFAPRFIKLAGERTTALVGFAMVSLVLLSLGFVHEAAKVIDPANPLRLIGAFGADLSPELRVAFVLALPLGSGLALTATSVQTYINRRVPLTHQGRVFALQSSLRNGVAIAPLLSLGVIASAVGIQPVLIATPFVLLGLAYVLLQISRYFGGHAPHRNLDVLATFWDEPRIGPVSAS